MHKRSRAVVRDYETKPFIILGLIANTVYVQVMAEHSYISIKGFT